MATRRYCCSISHSPSNNRFVSLHFSAMIGRDNLSLIYPPDRPQIQEKNTLLALFCLAPSGKWITESIMFSERAGRLRTRSRAHAPPPNHHHHLTPPAAWTWCLYSVESYEMLHERRSIFHDRVSGKDDAAHDLLSDRREIIQFRTIESCYINDFTKNPSAEQVSVSF